MSINVFGIDLFKIHWFHVLYVILALGALVMGTQAIYPRGMGAAVIYAIGAAMVFYFFDRRWFGTYEAKPNSWPPTINMCPDYLTFVPTITGSKSASGGGCVDMLGVTGTSGGITVTKKSELPTLNAASTQQVFQYTAADVKAATTVEQLQPICQACSIAGVTWEGVYDGDTCLGIAKLGADAKAAAKCDADLAKTVQDVTNSFYG